MLLAHQRREDRELKQRAWELFHLCAPYLGEDSEVTPETLFNAMPNSSGTPQPKAERMTTEQERERERRKNLPRVQRR